MISSTSSSNIRCFRIDPPPSSFSANEGAGGPAVWSHGFTEASGVKNKWVCCASERSELVCVAVCDVCVCVVQTVCGGAVGEQLLRQQRSSVRRVWRRQERGGAVFTAVHHERHTGRGASQDQERGRLHDQHLPRHAEVMLRTGIEKHLMHAKY